MIKASYEYKLGKADGVLEQVAGLRKAMKASGLRPGCDSYNTCSDMFNLMERRALRDKVALREDSHD